MCTSAALVAVEQFHICFNGFAASKTDFFVFSWNGCRIRTTPQRSNITGLKLDKLLE